MPLANLLAILIIVCSLTLGIYFIVLIIRIGKIIFKNEIIIEVPFENKSADFFINKDGKYSIWQKGKLFTRTPVDEFRPQITNTDINQEVKLSASWFRPNKNNGQYGSMELFNFHAKTGNYKLELLAGSSISVIERFISNLIPIGREVNRKDYSLYIRPKFKSHLLFSFVILIFISIATIVGGLIVAFHVESIFNL